jgi:hypothetical protein
MLPASVTVIPDFSFSWTVNGSACLLVGSDASADTIAINRGDGSDNESRVVSTGTMSQLNVTPVCHTYSSASTYPVNVQGSNIIYLDLGDQGIQSFTDSSSNIIYLNLVENNLSGTGVITDLFPNINSLRELNVADNAFLLSDYNDLLISLLGVAHTGIIDMGTVNYGGCTVATS